MNDPSQIAWKSQEDKNMGCCHQFKSALEKNPSATSEAKCRGLWSPLHRQALQWSLRSIRLGDCPGQRSLLRGDDIFAGTELASHTKNLDLKWKALRGEVCTSLFQKHQLQTCREAPDGETWELQADWTLSPVISAQPGEKLLLRQRWPIQTLEPTAEKSPFNQTPQVNLAFHQPSFPPRPRAFPLGLPTVHSLPWSLGNQLPGRCWAWKGWLPEVPCLTSCHWGSLMNAVWAEHGLSPRFPVDSIIYPSIFWKPRCGVFLFTFWRKSVPSIELAGFLKSVNIHPSPCYKSSLMCPLTRAKQTNFIFLSPSLIHIPILSHF